MTSWFFVEMAAKSALICSLALLLAMALRGRAAADRATVLRVGAGLLVALPLIAIAFPVLQIEAFAAPAPVVPANMTPAEMEALLALAATLPPVAPTIWDDPMPLLLILWGAGALTVMLRLVVGLATLSRWTRGAVPAADSQWLDALERARVNAGATDRLRLMVADKVPGPLGWGYRNPVILIDYDTYAEPEEADAILAHEVAHVARRDWPALMLTRFATALFWFNPLAWTLAREAIQQAEEAADAHAARVVDPTRYAETLLSWGQIGRGIGVPANSIAPGERGLSRRVRAVLDTDLLQKSARSRVAMVAVLLCVGVAAPVAALELVEAARPEAPAAPPAPQAMIAATVAAHPHPQDAPLPPEAPVAPRAPAAPQAPDMPIDMPDIEAQIAPAMEQLRVVLPRIPVMVHQSLSSIDRDELVRAMAHARSAQHLSRAQLREAMVRAQAAMPNAETIRVHLAQINPEALEARIRASMPSREVLDRQIRDAMRASRNGMAEGARGMEDGARQMEQQARRFRDREERERIIAEAREDGRTVTHDQLIEAADGLDEGARGMRDGARQMREGFREMQGD